MIIGTIYLYIFIPVYVTLTLFQVRGARKQKTSASVISQSFQSTDDIWYTCLFDESCTHVILSIKTECDYLYCWIKNGHIRQNFTWNGEPQLVSY